MEIFTVEQLQELLVAIFSLLAPIIIGWLVRLINRQATLRKVLLENDVVYQLAFDLVLRQRFNVTEAERLAYEAEAAQTGRDIRLVMAYHELDQVLAPYGITRSTKELIAVVERALRDAKADYSEQWPEA